MTHQWLWVLARLHYLLPWRRTFRLGGKSYRYFYHPYNTTWRNVRCVAKPLAVEAI